MSNDEFVEKILACRAGSVVAPAGCGKTECIADAVNNSKERYLVLTHTLAGVDSLRKRLKGKRVDPKLYDLATIAGWSLRFASAFPQRSGITSRQPTGDAWPAVYQAAEHLVARGFITGVLKASYIFRHLWQETVAALSTAAEVRFLGYSLAEADVHARFILRCGFHNQESGALQIDGSRADPTGRAKVTIIDPGTDGPMRITKAVGWECEHRKETIADWIRSMTKH